MFRSTTAIRLEPPVVARPRGLGVERARPRRSRRCASSSARSSIARLGPGEPRRGRSRPSGIGGVALQLPGVEQLQRAGPALGLGPEHRALRSCAMTSAACERRGRRLVPLVARARRRRAPPPAACVSTVSTPKPTGSACCTRDGAEAAGGLAGDVLEVRRVAPDHGAERHEAGVAPGAARPPRPRPAARRRPAPTRRRPRRAAMPASRQQASAPSSSRRGDQLVVAADEDRHAARRREGDRRNRARSVGEEVAELVALDLRDSRGSPGWGR